MVITSKGSIVEQVFSVNNRIIVDTATLMKQGSFLHFIERYALNLKSMSIPMIVPASVYQELVRHLCSEKKDQAEKAKSALEILRVHKDFFTAQQVDYSDDKVKKAFADREILQILSRDRGRFRQILITNDKGLSRDAYRLNEFESCSGKYIEVYYLNYHGELRRCNFDGKQQCSLTTAMPTVEKEISEESVQSQTTKRKAKPRIPWARIGKELSIGLALFVSGYNFAKTEGAFAKSSELMIGRRTEK